MWPLGTRVIVVHDLPLLVVDLLTFLVAHQQDHAAEQEDRSTPSDAVGPTEFPYGPVT